MPTITVIGKPLGQPRQKQCVRNGHAANYLEADHPIHGFKHDIKKAWTDLGVERLSGPCQCEITAYFARPASKTKKRGDNPALPHTSKPDCDNIAKAVLDSLSGIAFDDDRQVWSLHVSKIICKPNGQARVVVNIRPIDAEPHDD